MELWLVAGVVVTAAVVVFALLSRRGGEVIDAPRQAQPKTTASAASAEQDLSAGDMLKADGLHENDPIVHFADWLEGEASEEFSTASEQSGPTRRIADAARAVVPVILAEGRGVVDLPNLVPGRDFRREIDIGQLERAVAEIGFFDEHELTGWRRDPPRVRALAIWLAEQVEDEQPENTELVDDNVVRIVDAARAAVAEIDRAGRADIVLTAIGRNEAKQPFDVRRSVNASELQTMLGDFEANERVTTRTKKFG